MHDHKSHNHDGHKDMTYVDGSKTKTTDEMFSSFSTGLSNTQIVIVDVQGMVCDFCARGIEKTFNDDKDVKKVQVNLEKGKAQHISVDEEAKSVINPSLIDSLSLNII